MGLSISGYVLEPIRVGQANSPFSSTPNIVVTSQGAFDAAYPTAETEPRTEYHVFVLRDGKFNTTSTSDTPSFCWTKNEVINRFGYDGRNQRFKTLPGAPIEVAGTMEADANTVRLSGAPPLSTDTGSYPLRVSIGTDSGTAFPVTLVAADVNFGSPGAGTVEMSQETGNFNWNPADITSFLSQDVRFQRQSFFTPDESDANLGVIDNVLLLNPIPATGQNPLIRIGFAEYLTPVEVATDGAFSGSPTAGTVEWSLATGRLKFNPTDVSSNTGVAIYYDGVTFGFDVQVSTEGLGTILVPGTLSFLPDEDSDVFFTIPGVVTFLQTIFVDAFSLFGKRGQVEIRRSDNAVQFSLADKAIYGAQSVTAVFPDLAIERGMAVRFFRTPVDPGDLDSTLKDISAFYESTDATLADPLIGAPFFTLPAVPVDSRPIVVRVKQGTGTLLLDPLPRLDVPAPPAGLGYVIDYDAATIKVARRREDVVVTQSTRVAYSSVQLPDPGLFASALVLELEDPPGSATYTTLPATISGRDFDVVTNLDAGLITLTETDGLFVTSGSLGSFSGTTTFTDAGQNFTAAGVVAGDYLVVAAGAAAGVYNIDTVGTTSLTTDIAGAVASNIAYEIVRGNEILADRFFREVPALDPNTRVERLSSLGVTANAPRLVVDLTTIGSIRLRFGKTGTPFEPVQVVNDGAFTAPASLAAGVVEVSLDTGNLNFSQTDVNAALNVFLAKTLTIGTDFLVNAQLGFIEFTDRMLENEEVFLTYARINDDDEKVIIEERGVFIVRKELTADHPVPTATLSFNPLGREVATVPSPKAFRGGRPQVTGVQVAFSAVTSPPVSTVTFLPTTQVTDALPFGSSVGPEERVYIDYYVHEAIGGEKTVTVLQPPFVGVNIAITAGETEFTIAGDRTADFKANHLLRIDQEEIYLLSGSTYLPGEESTTVTIASPQEFRSDFRNPSLAVTSGQTRPTAAFFFPSYFVTELTPFETTARGQNRFKLVGDEARTYRTGTILRWEGGTGSTDYNYVEGSVYDSETNRTTVTMSSNGARQYTFGVTTLKRSVRPILSSPLASVTTTRSPDLDQSFTVWRRVEGEIGQVLVQPDDYTINSAGGVSFTDPLQIEEELSIFYTGIATIEDGRDFRASYSHLVVPSSTNGLNGQILAIDYTTYAPDSLYWRVEPMTIFRAELAEQFGDDAKAAIPSGGPRLENASQPKLFEQGRESVFYQEVRLANEDLVARPTLKFFNDSINLLEDALQSMDGRVVGDRDGRFLFDGLIDNPTRPDFASVTNHIDDIMKVSDAPFSFTVPGFVFFSIGTYLQVYRPFKFSRFFPTHRGVGVPVAPPLGLETGDTIGDIGFKNLSQAKAIFRRQPWGLVTKAATAADTTIEVDTTDEKVYRVRPKWEPASLLPDSGGGFVVHRALITDQDGTVLLGPLSELEVVPGSTTATTLTFTTPIGVPVPVGATVYQVGFDLGLVITPLVFPLVPHSKFFRANFDVGVDRQAGEFTHIQPFPPFDGTFFPPASDPPNVQNPVGGEVPLDVVFGIPNTLQEPYRFPALDGGVLDDDGNRGFPILNPWRESETGTNPDGANIGYLAREKEIIGAGGDIVTATTAAFTGTGSLSLSETRITLDSGTFPAPVPKVGDIVRITSGLNVGLDYRIVTAATATYVAVAGGDSWPSADTGFTFDVAVSASLASGVAASVSGFTLVTDGGAAFQSAGILPGHTLVYTTGSNAGLRRQVVSVPTETTMVTTAWPFNGAGLYVVDDSFLTFGGSGSGLTAELDDALDGQVEVLSTNVPPKPYNTIDALEMFLDCVFEDIFTGTTGDTGIGNTFFTDSFVDFTIQGISLVTDFIYMRIGASAGIYKLDDAGAITTTTLPTIVDDSFPATASGLSYRIVRPESASRDGLQAIFEALQKADDALADISAFQTLLGTTVSVLGDAGAHAVGYSFALRAGQVDDRIADIEDPGVGPVAKISSVMSAIDRLYDRRFVWIDGRTNLATGILPKKDVARDNRLKQQEDTLKALTKLLTT